MKLCEECGEPVVGRGASARFCVVHARRRGSHAPGRDRSGELNGYDGAVVGRVGSRLGVDRDALRALSGEERQQVLVELREVDRAFRRNPLLGYVPHAKQQRFHEQIGLDLRLYAGGNRAGKTTVGIVDSLIQTVDDEFVPDHLKAYRRFRPPFFCRVVTPDLSNTLEGVILQKIRDWCPAEQIRGGAFEKGYDKVLRVLHFRNGSWWQFNSNDQELNKLGGTALMRVMYDEEPRQDIRRECLIRTLDYGGDEIFALTPLMGLSWVYEDIYEPWRRGLLPKGTVTVSDMEENPHLDPDDIQRVLAGLSSEERAARKSGRFVHFAGLIFEEFSKSSHIVPALHPEDLDGEVYVGIDPGLRNAAVVWSVLGADDRLIVFDELLAKRDTIATVCKEIHARNAQWGVEPRWYVIDPASRNKNHQTGKSDQQEFIDHGIVPIPGHNSVTAGIQRIKARLEADPPRLVVAANCGDLRREFERYRWQKPKRVEGDPPDKPVKASDHLIDATRYIAMARPLRPDVQPGPRSQSLKDRLLREMLSQQGLGSRVDHDSGPGVFA